jgi:hypothetical protein
MMAGLLEGLQTGYKDVADFVGGVAPDLSTSLNAVTAPGSVPGGATAGLSVVQNITEVPTQSAQSIAVQSSRLLAHALATGG